MKYAAVVAVVCVLGVLGIVMHVEDIRDGARDARAQQLAAQNELLKAKYAEQVVRSTATADTVVRIIRRVSYARDTLLLHLTDTIAVLSYIYQTDTLAVQCRLCAARLDSLRTASDGTITAIGLERDYHKGLRRPGLRDRFGVFVGYGFAGNQPAPAIQIGVGVRAFP